MLLLRALKLEGIVNIDTTNWQVAMGVWMLYDGMSAFGIVFEFGHVSARTLTIRVIGNGNFRCMSAFV